MSGILLRGSRARRAPEWRWCLSARAIRGMTWFVVMLAAMLAGCATREQALIEATTQTVAAMGEVSRNGPPSSGGHLVNPLTARPYDQGPDPRARAEAQGVDEAQRLVDDGLYDRARSQVDRLLAQGCTHPALSYLKARLAVQADDLVGAIPWCDKAVAASPSWIEPRLLLARLYLKLERPGAAGSVYADIDRLAPWSPWGPYGVGWVAWLRGDTARAAERFDEALRRDPDHVPTLRVRAAVAQAAGDAAAEARCLTRALVLTPDDPALHLRLAELAQAQQRDEDTRRHLERAYALDPRPSTARRLADVARTRGDADAAAFWDARHGATAADPATPAPALTTSEVH